MLIYWYVILHWCSHAKLLLALTRTQWVCWSCTRDDFLHEKLKNAEFVFPNANLMEDTMIYKSIQYNNCFFNKIYIIKLLNLPTSINSRCIRRVTTSILIKRHISSLHKLPRTHPYPPLFIYQPINKYLPVYKATHIYNNPARYHPETTHTDRVTPRLGNKWLSRAK